MLEQERSHSRCRHRLPFATAYSPSGQPDLAWNIEVSSAFARLTDMIRPTRLRLEYTITNMRRSFEEYASATDRGSAYLRLASGAFLTLDQSTVSTIGKSILCFSRFRARFHSLQSNPSKSSITSRNVSFGRAEGTCLLRMSWISVAGKQMSHTNSFRANVNNGTWLHSCR